MATTTSATGGWPRWRLLATVGAAAFTTLLLLIGLVLAIGYAVAPAPASQAAILAAAPNGVVQGEAFRDQLAAAPMLKVSGDVASTPQVAAVVGPRVTVPTSTTTGPAGIASGFPHTPEGAVAQLAAIEVAVVEAMSIPYTHQVYDAWAAPGGAGAADWKMTVNVQSFLTAAGGQGNTKSASILVAATPAAAQIKGVDGPDWVLACVLLDVQAVIVTEARMGYGHCERMQWTNGRWLTGPGTPPAPAPSVWPGSDLAIRAGWRAWTTG